MNDLFVAQLLDLPNTYVGEAPPGTDSCQWIILSSGDSKLFFGREVIDSPECVVYARDPSNKVANTNIQVCLRKLQSWNDETKALVVSRLPAYVGRDEKHRSVYSLRVRFITGG